MFVCRGHAIFMLCKVMCVRLCYMFVCVGVIHVPSQCFKYNVCRDVFTV